MNSLNEIVNALSSRNNDMRQIRSRLDGILHSLRGPQPTAVPSVGGDREVAPPSSIIQRSLSFEREYGEVHKQVYHMLDELESAVAIDTPSSLSGAGYR